MKKVFCIAIALATVAAAAKAIKKVMVKKTITIPNKTIRELINEIEDLKPQ